MKTLIDRITINPDVCNGKPTIRGLRITAKTVLEHLAAGDTVEEILSAFPVLEKEDILAALQYASFVVDNNISISPSIPIQ